MLNFEPDQNHGNQQRCLLPITGSENRFSRNATNVKCFKCEKIDRLRPDCKESESLRNDICERFSCGTVPVHNVYEFLSNQKKGDTRNETCNSTVYLYESDELNDLDEDIAASPEY